MLGLFPFITMFIVTSITMLRERVTGTLERLMTLPLAKLDILLGYAIAFALVAVVQATVVSLLAFGLLDLARAGIARRRDRARGRQRDARDGARSLRERFRAHRVPGRAVHAGDRLSAGPPVRIVRRAGSDGALARGDLGRVSADVRVRRALARHAGSRARRLVRDRRLRRDRVDAAGARPRRRRRCAGGRRDARL